VDAFYMTVISVTTAGYREVHPLSRPGEVFTAVLLILGVGTVLYAVTMLVARVVEAGLHERWTIRRREHMLDELSRHFIVCGYGRIGSTIVEEFRRQGVPTWWWTAIPSGCTRSSSWAAWPSRPTRAPRTC